jgi:hypothetical protein
MSTAPVSVAAPAKLSLLQKIGLFFSTKFKPVATDVLDVAQALEPVVSAVLPGWSALYDSTVQMVVNAESAAAAAGAQNGSGVQKLASVTAALQPIATAYLKSVGVSEPTTAQIQAYINSVVAGLNTFEALSDPPAPAAS